MGADFTGETARLYAAYRRDLPAAQTQALTESMGLRQDDVVIDLGCGTGQLTVPLQQSCAHVVSIDPEPAMLAGLRGRGVRGVMCVLGDDQDLPELGRWLAGPVGAVVVGNALHWMDEPSALQACAGLLRRGGAVAVVTQGPPLWLGNASWQQRVRRVLEHAFGPLTDTCGSDEGAQGARVLLLEALGLDVQVHVWLANYEVDNAWVLGHLGSALPSGALQDDGAAGLSAALRVALDECHGEDMIEAVTTTAIIARRPS